jgi:hypothetical protein
LLAAERLNSIYVTYSIMKRAQGSIEMVIIIAAIVILAVAAYFVAKDFLRRSREDINATTISGIESVRSDINNLQNLQ